MTNKIQDRLREYDWHEMKYTILTTGKRLNYPLKRHQLNRLTKPELCEALQRARFTKDQMVMFLEGRTHQPLRK
jgi:hypothetical protein